MSLNYTAGDWHGHPNYECDLCSYSTLDETVMEYHQATVHIVFPKSGPPVSEWPAVLTSGVGQPDLEERAKAPVVAPPAPVRVEIVPAPTIPQEESK